VKRGDTPLGLQRLLDKNDNNNYNYNNCPTDHCERRSVGRLECLHKACQAAIPDGGLFTDTGVDERCENKRQGGNDCEMKTALAGSRGQITDKS